MRAREILEALFDKNAFDVQWQNQLKRAAPDAAHRVINLLNLARQAQSAGGSSSERIAQIYRNEAEALLAKEGIEVEFRQKEDGEVYPLFTVGARQMRSPERALSHAALLAQA